MPVKDRIRYKGITIYVKINKDTHRYYYHVKLSRKQQYNLSSLPKAKKIIDNWEHSQYQKDKRKF